MIIEYNREHLTRILEDISLLVGAGISVLDTDYRLIAAGKKKKDYCSLLQSVENNGTDLCHACDRQILERCRASRRLEWHICRAGLYDGAMPIMKDDVIVGFLILGQVRSVDSPTAPINLPSTDKKTKRELCRLYADLPYLSTYRLEAFYDLLPRILFEGSIRIIHDPLINEAVAYIDANLQGDLSIGALCAHFYVSKNYLYEAFRENLGNTVTGYVNARRIHQAKTLLRETEQPISEIAEQVGVSNDAYFCKLFKKLTGTTPGEYRTWEQHGECREEVCIEGISRKTL